MGDLERQIEWLTSGDTGVSSETIFRVMTGRKPRPGHWDGTPLDSDDFGRCFRLLERFPEWRARMGEVATRFPNWSGLVSEWPELERLWREGSRIYLSERIGALVRAGNEVVLFRRTALTRGGGG